MKESQNCLMWCIIWRCPGLLMSTLSFYAPILTVTHSSRPPISTLNCWWPERTTTVKRVLEGTAEELFTESPLSSRFCNLLIVEVPRDWQTRYSFVINDINARWPIRGFFFFSLLFFTFFSPIAKLPASLTCQLTLINGIRNDMKGI